MKTHEAWALRKTVRRLVEAEVAFSWRGVCEPTEMHEIEQERYVATCEFDALIDKLVGDLK